MKLLAEEILQDGGSLRWKLLLMNRLVYHIKMKISTTYSSSVATRIQNNSKIKQTQQKSWYGSPEVPSVQLSSEPPKTGL